METNTTTVSENTTTKTLNVKELIFKSVSGGVIVLAMILSYAFGRGSVDDSINQLKYQYDTSSKNMVQFCNLLIKERKTFLATRLALKKANLETKDLQITCTYGSGTTNQ